MDDRELVPGRVFVAPLLGGGFAFGVVTFFDKGLMILSDIFDVLAADAVPPPDLGNSPILIRNLQVGAEFHLTPKHEAGGCWKLTPLILAGTVRPSVRYFRMGRELHLSKRVDVFGEEPTRPLLPEEADAYPRISKPFPPVPVAEIEVAVKRLTVTPRALIAAWRAGELGTPGPSSSD